MSDWEIVNISRMVNGWSMYFLQNLSNKNILKVTKLLLFSSY